MLFHAALTLFSLVLACPAQQLLLAKSPAHAGDLYTILLAQKQHEYCSSLLSYRPETHTRIETVYSTVTRSQLTTGTVYAHGGGDVATVMLEKEVTFKRTSTVVAAIPTG